MPVLTYPGVYIEEFTPGAPIEGVGTSTAAFIGPAAAGELDTPTKITSFDHFREKFGTDSIPGFYLWYAVKGFFDNGGRVCYIVRATNGRYDGLGLEKNPPGSPPALTDRANNPWLRVRALNPPQAGPPAPPIAVGIAAVNQLANVPLYRPQAEYTVLTTREIQVGSASDAAQFRPGDWISLGAQDPRVQVLRVSGDRIRVASDLKTALNGTGTCRLADVVAGVRTIRISPAAALPSGILVTGTILTITQAADGGTLTDSQVVETVQVEPLQTARPLTTYRVTLRQGIDVAFSLDLAQPAPTVQSEEFDFTVAQGAATTTYSALSSDPAHPRYFVPIINEAKRLVQVELIEPPPPVPLPASLPLDTGGTVDLGGGAVEDLTTLNDADYIEALETLEEVDDVNLVSVPDGVPNGKNITPAVQQAIIGHCELLGDRFAVLDALPPKPEQDLFGPGTVEEQRAGLESTRGYAALYFPWLRVPPVGAGPPILVPPSGHMCGIMARSDDQRGVHKAPANEIVRGAVGVERTMTDIDQGQLNIIGINVVRVFQAGGRPMIWGARTTAPREDPSWRYINIRRLFLFLEESIQEGIRWAVFEPNNRSLWQKLKRTITDFLTRAWRDGALFGSKPEEAFYVRIDDVLNPFSEQALGRLHIEIGVRPSYPAEFIVVRIGIWPGGSEITES